MTVKSHFAGGEKVSYYPIFPNYSPWYWPSPYYSQPYYYPMMPWPTYVYVRNPMYQSYQSMFHQYPHQYYQQQGQRLSLGTDVAGVLGFGALRWLALRGLMGY